MKHKPLPIGVDDFEKLITNGYYFIDKTMFVQELLEKKGDVNLFTRPRRFGKSLNMSILRYFFEDGRNYDGEKIDYSPLFNGLNIMGCGENCLQHMGKHPVIQLSLKSAKQATFQSAYTMLVRSLAEEFYRHQFILQDSRLDQKRERYMSLMAEKANADSYRDSLKFLSECLNIYFGKKAIILIDEYDVPLESAHLNGYYGEMTDFIRSLFESTLKTNPNLEFAVLTGCLRISKESIFTGRNNLKIVSILNEKYDEYFGFTDAEVEKLCVDYGLSSRLDTIRDWYNGYIFGNANVYNPWSVIQFIDDLRENPNCLPSSYWANTSSNISSTA